MVSKGVNVMYKGLLLKIQLCIAVLITAAHAQASSHENMINVRAIGALGDGVTDDTTAFIKAVEKSLQGNVTVFVPRGTYRISQTIVVERTGISGPYAPAWPADIDSLPSIIPEHRDKPAFQLGAGGSLAGLDITYNWDSEPSTGSAAIVINGIGATVRDTRIRYAWDGIVADGTSNIGRTNLENIFMVSIKNTGVMMTGTWDVPRLNNIEVWNAGAAEENRGFTTGTGFHLGKNDLMRMTDCFVFGMHQGFLLESKIEGCEIEGDTWGVMNGCATDFCEYGIVVRGDHTLSVSGGSFWDHRSSLVLEKGKSRVRVSGSELLSNGAPAILVQECDHAVINGCTILRPMEKYSSPAVHITGGRCVLGSNHIESIGSGIQVEPSVSAAFIQGNMIDPHGRDAIVNKSGLKSEVVIENNHIVK